MPIYTHYRASLVRLPGMRVFLLPGTVERWDKVSVAEKGAGRAATALKRKYVYGADG